MPRPAYGDPASGGRMFVFVTFTNNSVFCQQILDLSLKKVYRLPKLLIPNRSGLIVFVTVRSNVRHADHALKLSARLGGEQIEGRGNIARSRISLATFQK